MSSQRFAPEFKEEAVRQVVKRGYSIPDVATLLGVSHTACTSGSRPLHPTDQSSSRRSCWKPGARFFAYGLRCVEEERDLLKKAARYFARQAE